MSVVANTHYSALTIYKLPHHESEGQGCAHEGAGLLSDGLGLSAAVTLPSGHRAEGAVHHIHKIYLCLHHQARRLLNPYKSHCADISWPQAGTQSAEMHLQINHFLSSKIRIGKVDVHACWSRGSQVDGDRWRCIMTATMARAVAEPPSASLHSSSNGPNACTPASKSTEVSYGAAAEADPQAQNIDFSHVPAVFGRPEQQEGAKNSDAVMHPEARTAIDLSYQSTDLVSSDTKGLAYDGGEKGSLRYRTCASAVRRAARGSLRAVPMSSGAKR